MKKIHLRTLVLGAICAMLLSSVITPIVSPVAAQEPTQLDNLYGPYVDTIIGEVIEGEELEALALLANDIDMIGEQMDPAYVAQLLADTDIKLYQTDRLGYGLTVLPTNAFPWNYTLFRRAFAYAFDKEEGVQDIWNGFATAQDSVIPSSQADWSYEESLPDTYYEQDIPKAIELMLAAGFVNDSTPDTYGGTYQDWWWEGPHGETIELEFWASLESGIARAYGDLIAENLREMHVKCVSRIESFNFWLPFLANHSLPAPVFLGNSLPTDPDWMEIDFHSDYAATPWANYASFQNSSVDALIEEMMEQTTKEDAQPIVDQLQELLWYESPYVLCYMNKILSFARTDDWEGFVNEAGIGTFDFWGRMKTRPITGGAEDTDGDGFGGVLRINLPTDIDTRNYLITSSGYTDDILETVYMPLVLQDAYDPSIDVPSLAYDWNVTIDDTANTTTIVFKLFENVTWHDGMPFTAHDVNFSMYYLRDLGGHNWIDSYPDVESVDILDNYTVQVNCDSDSFFVFHNVAFGLILPQHIWQDYPTVANYTAYDPEWPVGCGPFNFTAWVPGEYVQLDVNMDFHLLPPGRGAPAPGPAPIDPILIIAAVAVVAVVIIVGGYFAMRRGKA